MIRHTHQIGGVTVTFTIGHVDDLKIPAPRSPTPADGNGSEAHAAEATNGCGTTGHIGRECVGMPTGEASVTVSPNSFKIADWPSHERPDVWTWGDGVRLAESARAELGSSFLHGEPYADA